MYQEGVVIIAVLANCFVAITGQYVDIFQGLQAFLQPFQFSTDTNNYYDVTNRRPETRKHGDRRTGYDARPNNPLNNYYLYPTTTFKPSKKTTRPHSSQQYQPPTTRRPNKQTQTTRLPWADDNKLNNYNNPVLNYNNNINSNNNNNDNNYSQTNLEYNNNKPPTNNYNNNQPTGNHNNKQPTDSYNNEATTVSNAKPIGNNKNKPNNHRPINLQTNKLNSGYNLGKIEEPIKITSNRNVNVSRFTTTTIINNGDRVTTRPNIMQTTSDRQRPNYSTFTTKSPYHVRPGVKPSLVDENQPPITNKPVTQSPYYGTSKPSAIGSAIDGSISSPTIEIGPDEDDMSPAEKSRYIDLAESMCDNYKALSVREVVALPLVPSGEGVAVNVSDCTPLNIALIIGGKVSTIEEFPHMALVGWLKIQQNGGYSWKCGGSLISDQYILTAGHCTFQDKDYDVVSGPPHAVQLGSSLVDNSDALILKIASVIRHPKYKQQRSYYDIALLKLANRVTFSDVIRPACLGVPPPVGRPVIATGWGRTELGGDQSNELRSVSLPIWDMQDCRRIWGTSLKLPNGPTSDSHVCAGERSGGKDTCQGDSGGPAQIQEGCAWRVVAVTSYGRSCGAPKTPALYATIPRAFIAAQVFSKHRRNVKNPERRYEDLFKNNDEVSQKYQSASQQQPGNTYENQQQNYNQFGNQQPINNKNGNQQQNNDHENQQHYKDQYEALQTPNNQYASSQYTGNLYDNQQYSNSRSDKQQQSVNKYENQQPSVYDVQQQSPNLFNNQQNGNSYSSGSDQQIGNNYNKNPNTYQELSHSGNRERIEEWNKQNGNTGDEIPVGGWPVNNEREQNGFLVSQWNNFNQNNEDQNYFSSTARPWWSR